MTDHLQELEQEKGWLKKARARAEIRKYYGQMDKQRTASMGISFAGESYEHGPDSEEWKILEGLKTI